MKITRKKLNKLIESYLFDHEKPLNESDSMFAQVSKMISKPLEVVKSEYEKSRNTLRDVVVGKGVPLHHRGFAAYLSGRTETWTNSQMTNEEIDTIKKLVLYSLTPFGRYSSVKENKESSSDGALLNYGVTRGYIAQVGGLPSAIYRGEEGAGFSSGIFDAEPSDVIGKFLGAAAPVESKRPYKDLQKKVKNREPFTITIKDNYDFNDAGIRERGFKEGGFEYILDEFLKGYEKLGKSGTYEAVRYLAPLRQAQGYKGYKVDLKIMIKEKDYEAASDWLDQSYDEMKATAKTSQEKIKAAQAKKKKEDISEMKLNKFFNL